MTRIAFAFAAALAATPAAAHFGMIIPSDPMPSQQDGRSLTLTLSFSHPFEDLGMVLEPPRTFAVTLGEETTDLLPALAPATVMGQPGHVAEITLDRPGVHVFSMEPVPYWEPAEDAFIIHYTKTYVAAFGDDEGWDAELGLPTEIVPLTRPFGLWAGNVFQGIVKRDGVAVAFAEVEVEYYNQSGATVPDELMITQTVKADANGVFTYAAPVAGWWGFAALGTAEETMPHEGEAKAVEIGAVIWVRFEPWGGQ
jgi:cobalt/nickel transport protein